MCRPPCAAHHSAQSLHWTHCPFSDFTCMRTDSSSLHAYISAHSRVQALIGSRDTLLLAPPNLPHPRHPQDHAMRPVAAVPAISLTALVVLVHATGWPCVEALPASPRDAKNAVQRRSTAAIPATYIMMHIDQNDATSAARAQTLPGDADRNERSPPITWMEEYCEEPGSSNPMVCRDLAHWSCPSPCLSRLPSSRPR